MDDDDGTNVIKTFMIANQNDVHVLCYTFIN